MKGIKKWLLFALFFLFFCGFTGLLVYPLISQINASQEAEQSQVEYIEFVTESRDDTEFDEILDAAQRYNEVLCGTGTQSDTALLEAYSSLLDPIGNGTMGYIEIPVIDVVQPIRHGETPENMNDGVIHIYGTSLPVGGESTHTVLSGHTGMPGNKMFSDLTLLQIGDKFYLDILGQRLIYQVDAINVVDPYDTSLLQIVDGKDYCTLYTCTPYGVNSHRLLVRGERVGTEPLKKEEQTTRNDGESESTQPTEQEERRNVDSVWEREYKKAVVLGLAISIVAAIVSFVFCKVRKKLLERRR